VNLIESEIQVGSSPDRQDCLRYWGLLIDPFDGTPERYVPLPQHEEALARLSHVVESAQRIAILSGESGLGKSLILRELGRRLRTPGRRFVKIDRPLNTGQLRDSLAQNLVDHRAPFDCEAVPSWRLLEDAIRLQGWQQAHLIVLIDECQDLLATTGPAELSRIASLGGNNRPRITLVIATADGPKTQSFSELRDALPARLKRLTRSETELYVREKLKAAGRSEDAMTPNALTRLHSLSEGIPRALNRLASLCLLAGAVQRLEVIPPDLVDGLGHELWPLRSQQPA
jgi:hypothetical protein